MALVSNVVFALAPLISLIFLEYFITAGVYWPVLIFGAAFVFTFSHPTYLFFELKHLIDKENIIERVDIASVVVFGGLSLSGLVLQVATIIRLLALLNPAVYTLPAIFLLSLAAAIGGCLGLTDLVSRRGLWPPTFIKHLDKIVKSKKLLTICLGTTALLSVLTMLFI
ncbi:MAG: hypothetical protein ACD_61C00094G0003 [uncultured bacterium]|nr:MAG: hypothetical protein ACD_61C00094G0003 [uncultured bacterium]